MVQVGLYTCPYFLGNIRIQMFLRLQCDLRKQSFGFPTSFLPDNLPEQRCALSLSYQEKIRLYYGNVVETAHVEEAVVMEGRSMREFR